ncbi:MAG TPA: cytochrome c [Anaerolineales bacterium]|nr:cytochrome c [Anaerolineales bacterium]
MKTKFFLPFVLLVFVLLAACGGSPETGQAEASIGDATVGKTKFESTCIACHGVDAKGLPNLGKDLTTSEFVRTTADLDLVAFVMKGRPPFDPANTTGVDMPPKGGNPALTEEDIKDIISYVRTLQAK